MHNMKNHLFKIGIVTMFILTTHISYSQEVPNNEVETSENEPSSEILVPREQIENSVETSSNTDESQPESTNEGVEELPTDRELEALGDAIVEPIIEEPKVIWRPATIPNLSERQVTRKIVIDPNATHSCTLSDFSTDLGNGTTQVSIMLTKANQPGVENLEIGSLPDGINVKIVATGSYTKTIEQKESSVLVLVSKQNGAQQGSFNIPILYTLKNPEKTSTAICQINIVN